MNDMKEDELQLLLAVSAKESARDAGKRLGVHPKRVAALCIKWAKREWYSWGVSVDLGWLTPLGIESVEKAALRETVS